MKPSEGQIGGNHYKDFQIQPAEFIHKNGIGFLVGNVIKYVCRYSKKNGKEDLLKASHYIALLVEYEYGHENNQACWDQVREPDSGEKGR